MFKKIMKSIMKAVKDIWYRTSLIFYDKDSNRMSAGRLCFLILFTMACIMWWRTLKDIPHTMMECLFSLLTYNVIKAPARLGVAALQAKLNSILNSTPVSNNNDSKNDTPQA